MSTDEKQVLPVAEHIA